MVKIFVQIVMSSTIYTTKELNEAIKKHPSDFTEDLKVLFKKYENHFKPLK